MNLIKQNNSSVHVILFIFSFLIILKPYLGIIGTIILYGSLIFLPIFFIPFLKTKLPLFFLIIFLVFSLVISIDGATKFPDDFLLLFALLASSVLYFRFGYDFSSTNNVSDYCNSLFLGCLFSNLFIFIAFLGVFFGIVQLDTLYAPFPDKNPTLGLYRFTLGNAIEIPFLINAFIIASLTRARLKDNIIFFALTLNLILAFISQSRLIILMSFFTLLHVLSFRTVFYVFLFGFIALFLNEEVVDYVYAVSDSVVSRFYGEDYGSGNDRASLFQEVFNRMDGIKLLFGSGLAESAEINLINEGKYRTVESALLQLIYELGIVGLGMYFLSLFYKVRIKIYLDFLSLAFFVLLVELLFFLPIFSFYPFIMFSVGFYISNILKA